MFEHGWPTELMVFLATAGLIVPLFGKLRFGVVPGFLIAGVLLGPGGLGHLDTDVPWLDAITFSDPERVRPFAELGVLFLLFVIGLEFSLDRLWAMRRYVLGLGPLQFFPSAAVIIGVELLLGVDYATALVVGLALALSSTAIVTQILIEGRRFAGPVGRVSLGVLLFQDLMVVPIVVVVGLLSGNEPNLGGALLRAVGLAVLAVAVIVFVGRYLVRPLMRLAGATGSRELIVAIAILLTIATALATETAGLSSALGAFLAGLLLSESEYRHQLEVDIEPFKGLLLGLFFMTVGMSFDIRAFTVGAAGLVAAVAGLFAIKAAIMFAAARAFRVETPVAVHVALLIAGAGEFAFVVFTLAARDRVLDLGVSQILISISALSMILVPGFGAIGNRLGAVLARRQGDDRHGIAARPDHGLSDHVIIGGYGRVGQTVAQLLDQERIPYVALDLDAETVARERQAGRPVFFGDASRHEILEKIGGGAARAFVVTTDAPAATERMVAAIHAAWPQTPIHARAKDAGHARRLIAAGATNVVPEALEGSLQLASAVLTGIGLPDDAVDTRIDFIRDDTMRRLTRHDG